MCLNFTLYSWKKFISTVTCSANTELQIVKISGRSPEQQIIVSGHRLFVLFTLRILREFHVVCYHFLLSPGQYSVTIVREDFYFLLVRLWLGGNIDAFISWNDSHIALLTSLSPKIRGAKIKITHIKHPFRLHVRVFLCPSMRKLAKIVFLLHQQNLD